LNSLLKILGYIGKTKVTCVDWGFSDVMLRELGVCWDLQKLAQYDVYKQLIFYVPMGAKRVRSMLRFAKISTLQCL